MRVPRSSPALAPTSIRTCFSGNRIFPATSNAFARAQSRLSPFPRTTQTSPSSPAVSTWNSSFVRKSRKKMFPYSPFLSPPISTCRARSPLA